MSAPLSASACHIGGPIDVNPGELTLVYGTLAEISVLLALYILVNFVIFFSFLIRTSESVAVLLLRQNDIAGRVGSSAHKVISISDLTKMLYLIAFFVSEHP